MRDQMVSFLSVSWAGTPPVVEISGLQVGEDVKLS
jgi:hypothetical protein